MERCIQWKTHCDHLYDYKQESLLAEPCTSLQWGLKTNSDTQRIYFCCNMSPSCYLFIALVTFPPVGCRGFPGLQNIYHQHKLKKYGHLQIKAMIEHPGEANVLRHNGKWLATKNDENVVNGWADGKKSPDWTLANPTGSSGPNFGLSWASTSRLVSSGGRLLDIYDVMSGTRRELSAMTSSIPPVLTLLGHEKSVQDVSFQTNSHEFLASVGQDAEGSSLRLWDIRMKEKAAEPRTDHTDDINCVAWHGSYLFTGGSDRRMCMIDSRKGCVLETQLFGDAVMSMAFSPSTEHLAVGS